MGRIRSIKPEILTDEKAATLSHEAWRLWVSMWVLADDTGRLPASPTLLAAQVFWGKPADASKLLLELEKKQLVKRYSVRGENYAEISGFARHQKINRPSGPKHPGPLDSYSKSDDSLSVQGDLDADHDHDRDHDHAKEAGSPAARAVVPPEAFDLADVLREHLVTEKPDHELGEDLAWARKRPAWARAMAPLLRAGREASRARALLAWVFGDQGGTEFRFRVDSPKALREKWDRIETAMGRKVNGGRPSHGGGLTPMQIANLDMSKGLFGDGT